MQYMFLVHGLAGALRAFAEYDLGWQTSFLANQAMLIYMVSWAYPTHLALRLVESGTCLIVVTTGSSCLASSRTASFSPERITPSQADVVCTIMNSCLLA